MYIEKHNVDINHLNQFDGNALMINKNIHMIKFYVENECNIKQLDIWGRPNWYFHKNFKIFKYLIDNDSPIDSNYNYNNEFMPIIFKLDNIKKLKYIMKNRKINLNNYEDLGGHNGYFWVSSPKFAKEYYKNGLKFKKSVWKGYPFNNIYSHKTKLYLAKLFIYDKLVFWSNRNKIKTLLHRYTPKTRENKKWLMNELLCFPTVSCFPGGQTYLEAQNSFYNNIKILNNK